jgi:hypothetical protein
LLGGCGGDEGSPATTETSPPTLREQRLTAEERDLARRSEREIAAYCRRLALSVAGERKSPSPRQEASAFAAADRLIGLARRKPAAEIETGVDLRLKLGDIAENLEGSNCDPRIVARLEAGFASVPPP